jgi:nucleoside-diphosphate-sugar epimerase
MKILVTGHHGYIGSIVGPSLAATGHDVTGLDTFFYQGCNFVPDGAALPGLRMDVRDVTVADLVGYDAVVHLAALSNDPIGELNAELTNEINFRATVALAGKAKEAGVRRFVFASSCSMYGAAEMDDYVTEEAPLRPLTAYAESKVRAEEALAELADDDFSPVFLRNATAYGVSPRLRFDIVLNNLAGWAYTTKRVLIMSDGSPWRPLVHVRDIADATLAMLTAPAKLIHNQAFNIGANSENYRVRELAEVVRDTFSGCVVEYAADAGPDPRSYRADFGKLARTFPGFRARWTAADGCREFLSAFRTVGLTTSAFQGDKYTRLARLKLLAAEGRLGEDLRWLRVGEPTVAWADPKPRHQTHEADG